MHTLRHRLRIAGLAGTALWLCGQAAAAGPPGQWSARSAQQPAAQPELRAPVQPEQSPASPSPVPPQFAPSLDPQFPAPLAPAFPPGVGQPDSAIYPPPGPSAWPMSDPYGGPAPHCCSPPYAPGCSPGCGLGAFFRDIFCGDPWFPNPAFSHPALCPEVIEPRCVHVPNMIGDFFAGPLGRSVLAPPGLAPMTIETVIPNPSGGGAVGFTKISENSSPLPRTRIFTNFTYLDDVPFSTGGVHVSRLAPGFEKAFFNGLASLEMRFPFASTLDSGIIADGATNTDELEFGNLMLAVKGLLYSNPYGAVSTGLAFSLPTADDVKVNLADGTRLVQIENDAVHLMPFLAGLYTPNDRFFAQGFLQFDFDANGNPVFANDTGLGLRRAGRIDNPVFLYLDVGAGYWLYRQAPACAGIVLTGVAPTLELHYNRSLDETDVVSAGGFRVGEFKEDVNVLNLVVGATFEFGSVAALTLGYSTPLAGGSDEQYDGMFRATFNRYFAPPRGAIVR